MGIVTPLLYIHSRSQTHPYNRMKLLFAACLFVAVAIVHSERCYDKDPLTCTVACGPNQVHSCRDDRCYCMPGEQCLLASDCHMHCKDHDFHSHCIDGECHCLKMDEIDNSDK